MKRARLALPLTAMVVALASTVPPTAHATIRNNEAVITGKVLYAMCTNDDADIARRCTTFIRGFVDGARTAAEMTSARPFFCLPDSAGTDLVVLAFTREVERLPRSSMDDTAANVLRNALWLAFPCTAAQ